MPGSSSRDHRRSVEELVELLAGFLGLADEQPSFQLGNRVVKSVTFRETAAELRARATGRSHETAPLPLTTGLARLLKARGVATPQSVEERLRSLERFLEFFLKLVEADARPEIHRAMLDAFNSAVREQVLAPAAPARQRLVTVEIGEQRPSVDRGGRSGSKLLETVKPPELSSPTSREELELTHSVGQFRLDVLDPLLARVRKGLGEFTSAEQELRRAPLGFTSAVQLVRVADALQVSAQQLSSSVADFMAKTEESGARHGTSLAVIARVMRQSGLRDLPVSLMMDLVSPEGSSRIASLMEVASFSGRLLPKWLTQRWFGDASELLERTTLILGDAELCTEVVSVKDWLDALPPNSRELLLRCERPASEVGIVEGLKQSLARLLEIQRDEGQWQARINPLKGLVSDSLVARFDSSRDPETEALLVRTEVLARRVMALDGALGAEATKELRATLLQWPAGRLPETLNDIEAALESLGPEIVGALSTLSALSALARKMADKAPVFVSAVADSEKSTESDLEPQGVSIDHPLTRVENSRTSTYRASLVWVPVPSAEYGVVRAPVRLKVPRSLPRETEWQLEFSADVLNRVPSEWLRMHPSRMAIQLPANASHRDVFIELPISKGHAELIAAENRNLTVQFTVSRGGEAVSRALHWKGLAPEMPRYVSPLPITATRKEMDRHPLGVEREFSKLQDLMTQARKSFRVHGPRRMGKTTLIRALKEHFDKSRKVVVLESVVASQYRSAREVWEVVAERLSHRFNRPVKVGKQLPPSEGVFDAVREAAKESGFSAVYVIVDEAQALFSLSGEPQLHGEAIKARLESDWALESDTKASLLLGLVGQAHLPELMGSNLLGAISDAVTADSIKAEELSRLLRSTQGEIGFQSTTEARESLALQAGNLWVLGSLLGKVADRCRLEGRPWFTEEDVELAVQELVEADGAGTETTLWSYVRDVLNESDDKDRWRPSEAYPVAMAWAYVRGVMGDSLSQDEKVSFIEDTLREWGGSWVQRRRVEETFSLLKRQRVLKNDGSFELPILERLLKARATRDQRLSEEDDRRALNRLGLRRLATPPDVGAENLSGGQATVYRSKYGGSMAAVRKVLLTDSKAERRFIREVELLERLAGASGDVSRDAQAHLPRLYGTGIDPSAPDVGLVVYEWVEGAPLDPSELTSNGALLVLQGLLRALRALYESGIIHRDIRPDNVLIRESKSEAVLIDFGLSVAVDEIAKTTALAGVLEFLPPEVKRTGDVAAWSHAGDMYSAAMTVAGSLAVKGDKEVTALLNWMMSADPRDRPRPDIALERVEGLIAKRQLRESIGQFERRFEEMTSRLDVALRDAVQSSMADFVSAQSGVASTSVRLLRASMFLESLVQAKLRLDHRPVVEMLEAGGAKTFLSALGDYRGKVPPAILPLAKCEEARVVGALRNASAHGAEATKIMLRASRQLPRELKGRGEDLREAQKGFQEAVRRVGNQVGILLSRPEVKTLVREWVS